MPIVHSPTIIPLGPFPITGFGIAVMLAFVLGGIVGVRELERRGHDPSAVNDIVFASIIGFIIGAKLYYAALTGDVGQLWGRGGFVYWGGLAGGVAAGMLMAWRRKMPIMRICDVGGPGIAAGYAIGRSGCWAIGDDYGTPWNGFLATEFPRGAPPSTAHSLRDLFGVPIPADVPPETVIAVHPTQLYETAMGLAMFAFLWRLRAHRHAEGWLFGLYLVLAGVERFVVEFFRAKDDRIFGMLTLAQAISIAMVVAGAIWMAARWNVGGAKKSIYAKGTSD